MREVNIHVGATAVGRALTWAYPDGDRKALFLVPTYTVTVSAVLPGGESRSRDFEALRFGVKQLGFQSPRVVGLADAQSHVIKTWIAEYSVHSASSVERGAWQVYGNFLVHDGPDLPMGRTDVYASVGCVEICGGPKGFDSFNDFIIELAEPRAPGRAEKLFEIGCGGKLRITYAKAQRPKLQRFEPTATATPQEVSRRGHRARSVASLTRCDNGEAACRLMKTAVAVAAAEHQPEMTLGTRDKVATQLGNALSEGSASIPYSHLPRLAVRNLAALDTDGFEGAGRTLDALSRTLLRQMPSYSLYSGSIGESVDPSEYVRFAVTTYSEALSFRAGDAAAFPWLASAEDPDEHGVVDALLSLASDATATPAPRDLFYSFVANQFADVELRAVEPVRAASAIVEAAVLAEELWGADDVRTAQMCQFGIALAQGLSVCGVSVGSDATKALDVALACVTGNYIGTVQGLVSASAVDPAAARHEELMKAIAQLARQVESLRTEMHERFDAIDRRLNRVFDGIAEVLLRLQETEARLDQIEELLNATLREVASARADLVGMLAEATLLDFRRIQRATLDYAVRFPGSVLPKRDFRDGLTAFLTLALDASSSPFALSATDTPASGGGDFISCRNDMASLARIFKLGEDERERLLNLAVWRHAAEAYCELILRYPQYSQGGDVSDADVTEIIRKGERFEALLARLMEKERLDRIVTNVLSSLERWDKEKLSPLAEVERKVLTRTGRVDVGDFYDVAVAYSRELLTESEPLHEFWESMERLRLTLRLNGLGALVTPALAAQHGGDYYDDVVERWKEAEPPTHILEQRSWPPRSCPGLSAIELASSIVDEGRYDDGRRAHFDSLRKKMRPTGRFRAEVEGWNKLSEREQRATYKALFGERSRNLVHYAGQIASARQFVARTLLQKAQSRDADAMSWSVGGSSLTPPDVWFRGSHALAVENLLSFAQAADARVFATERSPSDPALMFVYIGFDHLSRRDLRREKSMRSHLMHRIEKLASDLVGAVEAASGQRSRSEGLESTLNKLRLVRRLVNAERNVGSPT